MRRAQTHRHKQQAQHKATFLEHLHELKRRLFFVALAVVAGGAVAYKFREPITDFLLWPAGGQQFIFTSPAGGFEFLFRICLYTGIVAAIPVIIYQLMRYLQPLIRHNAMRVVVWGTVASVVLAVTGMAFGYFFGLPAALNFLLQNFTYDQVEALITIQSYMSFVTIYMLGAALIFQVPLVLLFINRIKPLKPSKLFTQQRWFVVGAFVVAALITPAPDIPNLLILAMPMILMYHLGVMLVWLSNRKHRRPRHLHVLREQDAQAQAARLEQFRQAREAWQHQIAVRRGTPQAPRPTPRPQVSPAMAAAPARRRPYLDQFTRHPQTRPLPEQPLQAS